MGFRKREWGWGWGGVYSKGWQRLEIRKQERSPLVVCYRVRSSLQSTSELKRLRYVSSRALMARVWSTQASWRVSMQA